MKIKSISGRAFNQNVSGAKRAAENGPVFITDRGRPAHVLMSIEMYQKISKKGNIIDLLAMPDAANIEFEAPKLKKSMYRPADLS